MFNSNNNSTKNKFVKYQKKITFKLIYDLYKTNFIDNCELILLEKQNIFLDNFFNKMIYIIKAEFTENIFEKNKSLYDITKKCENDFIKEVYWPMFDTCSNAYENFKINKHNNNINKINFVKNFSSHCNYEQIALHICGAKMLEINFEKKYLQNIHTYVLCTGCKKCYFGNRVPGYCPFAQKQYYFKINDQTEKETLDPATWEEYHCKDRIINEQMSCVRCGSLLYLKEDNLFCKKCKLNVDPLMIVWTCIFCKKEFKSKAKKYNPLEFQEEENAIKEAFLYKIIAKPNELPCKCIRRNNLKNTHFYHNKKCKGLMYFSKLRKNEILVCSLCKAFYDIKKFLWNCPICEKNFLCKNISLNSKNDNYPFFSKIKNEKNKKQIILSEQNNKFKNPIFLNLAGTPIREEKLNTSINNNIKSYVKKKPEDYYNYTNRNRSGDNDDISKSREKKTKRNLSIVFKNKYLNKNNDIFINDMNSAGKKEDDNNVNNKFYNTNFNFYKSQIFAKSSNKKENDKDNTNSFLINNIDNYLKTEKNLDKKYSKINYDQNISPKIKTLRYYSTSGRNYNPEEKNNILISDFDKFNSKGESNLKQIENRNNNSNINNYKIYIPKRKLDMNKSNLYISTNNNNNELDEMKQGNDNIGFMGKKIKTSNSVGIRDRYKKIKNTNKDNIINLDYKRNIQPILDVNEEKEINDYSYLKTQKDFNFNKINQNEIYNREFNKNIRSSSQIRIERNNKYFYNNKYNKRYINSKYDININNINSSKNGQNNIYQRIITNNSNNINNKNTKETSTTNKSNGADSFVLKNQFDNKNNIYNDNERKNNITEIKNKKENSELKEFNFNDYKIITQLGQGTFGKIYLVQDKNNQLFSMKKIILSEELDVQSVINEYKMCQKLSHENIVKILGIYSNKLDATTYVVYVLMEVGMTDWEKQITSYADKKLEYSEKNLIDIIKQLSTVLSFLQKNNTSHRDIKPQNILVFKDNIYKLADFGEAKQIDGMKNLLVNYSLRGTELYMSPLLFNGLRNGQIDIKHNLFKSDVYSLGLCLLFAAVTNNKPLYEIRKFIDMKNVKIYLEKILKRKYSHNFIDLLSSMLEIHEKNRPDFIELEQMMKKW